MRVTVPNVLGSPLTYERIVPRGYDPKVRITQEQYDALVDADSDVRGLFGYQEEAK